MKKYTRSSLPKNMGLVEHLYYKIYRNEHFLEELYQYTELKILELVWHPGAKMKLPQLAPFSKLEQLSITGLEESVLPADIAQLTKLESLSITRCSPDCLPEELAVLQQMKRLEIKHTTKGQFPEVILKLKNLEKLVLRSNELKELPSAFCNLKSLKILDLFDNRIQELPVNIGNLSKLQRLKVDNNQLTTLPSGIYQLKELEELTLSDNQLQKISKELDQLKKIEILRLESNQLEEVPDHFDEMSNLWGLYLHDNQLKKCPVSMVNCPLRVFSWLGNPFGDLPVIAFDLDKDVFDYYYGRQTYHKLWKFVERCKKINLTKEDKQAISDLYNENEVAIDVIPTNQLFHLMSIKEQQFTQKIQNYILARSRKDYIAKPVKKGSIVHIAGKTALNKNEVKATLKEHGIGYTTRLTKEVTHVVLGSSLKKAAEIAAHVAIRISEADLLEVLNQLDTPYLLEEQASEEIDITHIQQLLLSREETNVTLGIELLEGGGVPKELITELFIVYKLSGFKKPAKKAKKLLQLNGSEALQTTIKSRRSMLTLQSWKVKEVLAAFTKDTELEVWKIAQYGFYHYPNTWGLAIDLCMEGADEGAARSFALHVLSNKVRACRLSFSASMNSLAPYVHELEGIKYLQLSYNTTCPSYLHKLPHLEELLIQSDRAIELPVSLAQSASLQVLKLYSYTAALPAILAQYTALKGLYLNLSAHDYDVESAITFKAQLLEILPALSQLEVLELQIPYVELPDDFFQYFPKLRVLKIEFYETTKSFDLPDFSSNQELEQLHIVNTINSPLSPQLKNSSLKEIRLHHFKGVFPVDLLEISTLDLLQVTCEKVELPRDLSIKAPLTSLTIDAKEVAELAVIRKLVCQLSQLEWLGLGYELLGGRDEELTTIKNELAAVEVRWAF